MLNPCSIRYKNNDKTSYSLVNAVFSAKNGTIFSFFVLSALFYENICLAVTYI